MTNAQNSSFEVGQAVFARWAADDSYYPANIRKIFPNHVEVNYLDGELAVVANEHIIEWDTAFKILAEALQ